MPEFMTNYVGEPVSFTKMGREIGEGISKSLFTIAALKRQEQEQSKQRADELNRAYGFDAAQGEVLNGSIIPRYAGMAQEALNTYQQAGAQAKLTGSAEDVAKFQQAKQNFVTVTSRATFNSKSAIDTSLKLRQGAYPNLAVSAEEALADLNQWMNSPLASAELLNEQDLYVPPSLGETSSYMPEAYAKSRFANQFQGDRQYYGTYETGHFNGTMKDAELFPDMKVRFENAMKENPAVSNLAVSQFAYRAFDGKQGASMSDVQLNQTAPTLYPPAKNEAITEFEIVKGENGLLDIEYSTPDTDLTKEEKAWRRAYKLYASTYLNIQYGLLENGNSDQTPSYQAFLRAAESSTVADQLDIAIGRVYPVTIEEDEGKKNYIAGNAFIDGKPVTVVRGNDKLIFSEFLFSTGKDGELVPSKIVMHKPKGGIDLGDLDGMSQDDLMSMLASNKFEEVVIDRLDERWDGVYNSWLSTKKGKYTGEQTMPFLIERAEGVAADLANPANERQVTGQADVDESNRTSAADAAATQFAGGDMMLYADLLNYFGNLDMEQIESASQRLGSLIQRFESNNPGVEWELYFTPGSTRPPMVVVKR